MNQKMNGENKNKNHSVPDNKNEKKDSAPLGDTSAETDLILDEILIEELQVDGICGVY